MKDLKKIITGIMIVFCLLIPLKTVQGWEVIPPVSVSDKSVIVKKIIEKKKGRGEKYYFFCLQAQSANGKVQTTGGILNVRKSVNPDIAIKEVRKYGAKRYSVDIENVVVTAFNRIE